VSKTTGLAGYGISTSLPAESIIVIFSDAACAAQLAHKTVAAAISKIKVIDMLRASLNRCLLSLMTITLNQSNLS